MRKTQTGLAALTAVMLSGTAFARTLGFTLTDLGDLAGGSDVSVANGINDAGQVVGYSGAATGTSAFLWDETNGMQALGYLPVGGYDSRAHGINNAGQIAGESLAVTGGRAFLWDETNGMKNLGDLPGGRDFSSSSGINDAGQVVGYSSAATSIRAFLWDETNGMKNLGDLPGGPDFSRALGINDAGQVVGNRGAAGGSRAFLWDETNGMRNLNDLIDPSLGWILYAANAINENGLIVGFGFNGTSNRAFLLTPETDMSAVPLPAGAWLMISALLGLGFLKRRGLQTQNACR